MRIREVALDEVLEEEAKAAGAKDGGVEFAEERALGERLEVRVAALRKGAEGQFRGCWGGGGGGLRGGELQLCDGRVVAAAAAGAGHCLRRNWDALHFTCPSHQLCAQEAALQASHPVKHVS